MNKKVYFAGSIRAGRVDAGLYHRLITYIQNTDTVLTEHVGFLNLRESRDDIHIYEQDTAWLREADLLIGEVTCPSLGVGYELAYAERFEKPCYLFYNPAKANLSAMLTGDSYFHIYPYEKEEEIYPVIDEILHRQ
ncbi:MAG: nucleoside 2-deoxyribosyltransferase [Oscillospiraceae bacterium]|nr:nucleoside 2-deoxyribosyltransferase [Oscillospiraceae bacterium]MBO7729213.1 nucleoside 2-deoxyribosyltransferase [Oscillospiraceae bacterium]